MEFLKNDKEINAYGHMDEKAFFEPYNAPFRQLWSQAMAKLSRMAAHLTPGQNQELQECVEQLCQAQSDYAGGRFVRGYHVGMAAAMEQYGIPGAAEQAQLIPGLEKLEDLAQELNNVKQAHREHPRDAMPLHTTPCSKPWPNGSWRLTRISPPTFRANTCSSASWPLKTSCAPCWMTKAFSCWNPSKT